MRGGACAPLPLSKVEIAALCASKPVVEGVERAFRFIWPELEFNSTFWNSGPNAAKKRLFVTPGLYVGRIPLHNRVGLTMGVGLQVAATKFHNYDHSVIFSFRLPF